jgi:alpha-glucosidase (family GH31 glycosyl hydrolase)
MAHEFPTISECWSLDEQFLWGSNLLIAPVISQYHLMKSVYFPRTERWFDYYTGEEQNSLGEISVPAPLNHLPLFIRGGAIIPHQQSAMNTVLSRKKPMYLVIALDSKEKARGDLFWDDGESIDTYQTSRYNYFIFAFNSQRLTLEPWTYNYPEMGREVKLEEIKMFGLNKQPTRIVWNGEDLSSTTKWSFDAEKKILIMKTLALDMSKTHRFVFSFV